MKFYASITNPVDFARGTQPTIHVWDCPITLDGWLDIGCIEIEITEEHRKAAQALAIDLLEKMEAKKLEELQEARNMKRDLLSLEHKD